VVVIVVFNYFEGEAIPYFNHRTGSTETRIKVDIAYGIRTATNALGKKAGKHRLENNTWKCFLFKVIKNYNHHCMNVIDTAIYTKLFRTKKIRSVASVIADIN
jgi:hypothetical protein